MNYARIYYTIIENRILNPYKGYTERHHIIPVSLGGADSTDNLVNLTAREHFICHWLLIKMYKNNKMSYYKMLKAFNMMCSSISKNQQRHIVSSRIFARYREDFSKAMSALQIGDKNSQSGTMWICSIDQQINKKVIKGNLPPGWIHGRNKWKILEKNKLENPKKQVKSKKYMNGYEVSVDGIKYKSISHAADSLGLNHETARMRFKSENFPKYIVLCQ